LHWFSSKQQPFLGLLSKIEMEMQTKFVLNKGNKAQVDQLEDETEKFLTTKFKICVLM